MIVPDRGDVIARGEPKEIQSNTSVIAAYPERMKRSLPNEPTVA